MKISAGLVRLGTIGVAAAGLAGSAGAEKAKKPVGPSVAGDPSCAMTYVAPTAGSNGSKAATGQLMNTPGTLVRDGVAAVSFAGEPGLVVIDAQWTDPARHPGPDIEIVQCQTGYAGGPPPAGKEVTTSHRSSAARGRSADSRAMAAAAPSPRRLDRSYDRNIAAKDQPGHSRAALLLPDKGDYVVLIGGAPAGTAFNASILRPSDTRPPVRPLDTPLTRGTIDANSPRQNASLRPYALYSLTVEKEGPVLFRGTATSPVFLEVGDVSDDSAFDWFGLRRAAAPKGAEGAEIERLMLWRSRVEPDRESVFGLNLKPGSYLVRIRGVTPDSSAAYTIAQTVPNPADLMRIPDPEPIRPGVTRGTLVIGESFSQDPDGSLQVRPTKLYQFTGKAGTGYEVRLESDGPELDPFIGAGGMLTVLETPTSNSQRTASGERFFALVANNDHPNVAGLKSPTASCLFFTPSKSGPIVLKVIGTRINQAGGYTLTLNETAAGCVRARK